MITQMVDKSNFDNKQYKADLQSAYECGFVIGAIEELEKLKLEMSPDSDDVWRVWNRTAVKIIDRHIADLKGENKNE